MKKRPTPRKRNVAAAKPKAYETTKEGSPKSKTAQRLTPEVLGYVLTRRWETLFRLYVRKDEVFVQLEPELAKLKETLRRGRGTGRDQLKHVKSSKLEQALRLLDFVFRVHSDRKNNVHYDQVKPWVHKRSMEVLEAMGEALSPHLRRLTKATLEAPGNPEKHRRRAEQASSDLNALFLRTLYGMIREAFPARAPGSGEDYPKELLAIEHAQMLCGQLRRLPAKTEVRKSLEELGVKYPDNKNQKGKWKSMFDRAGLSELPD